jgi:type IV pilus assembly protein PilC
MKRFLVKKHKINIIIWDDIASLLESGIRLYDAISIIAQQQKKSALRKSWRVVLEGIAGGLSLHLALDKVFFLDRVSVSCICSGENSGSLAQACAKLYSAQLFKEQVTGSVKKLLYYPAIVLSCTLLVLVMFCVKILPSFLNIFMQSKSSLPASTKFVLAACSWLEANFLVSAFVICIVIALFGLLKKLSFWFNKIMFRASSRVGLIAKYREYVLLDSLTLCLANGVSLLAALQIYAKSCRNLYYSAVLLQVIDAVAAGQYLSAALRQNFNLSPGLLKTVEIAEQAGNMAVKLQKHSIYLQKDLQRQVADLTKIMQPLIMIFLAVVVGGAVAAIYMPIFSLGQNL